MSPLVAVLLAAATVAMAACPKEKSLILAQITTTLGQTALDATQIDAIIAQCKAVNACIPQSYSYTGAQVVQMCDMDSNGVLDSYDWTHPMGCVTSKLHEIYACRLIECYALRVVDKK